MSRTKEITIKSIPFNKPFDLLKSEIVVYNAGVLDMAAAAVKNVTFDGIRITTASGKLVYFPIPFMDGDGAFAVTTADVATARNLTYNTSHLGMSRFEHRREFPNLFASDRDVVWFGAQVHGVFLPTTSQVNTGFKTKPHHMVGFEQISELTKNEIADILSGEMSYDVVAVVEFVEKEKPLDLSPEVDILRSPQVGVKNASDDKVDPPVVIPKFEMGRDKLDGRVYVQQCHSIGSGVTKVVANFNIPEDAYIFVTVKQAIARAGLTTDMFLKLFPPIENDKNR